MGYDLLASDRCFRRNKPMQLIEVEQKLRALKQVVLQTRDVSAHLNIPIAQASKILQRLAANGRFVRLMRGKWATTKNIDPLVLPEYLTAPFPSYISLQTALFYHGMISQIPHTIYVVSLDRTQQFQTAFGHISIHHIQPDFFFDFEKTGDVNMASAEKAFIDFLYLTPAKSKLFKHLPEVEFPDHFDFDKAKKIIEKIPSMRTRILVKKRFDHWLPK
jgi:predicted transcriptional regulator of viral defense system